MLSLEAEAIITKMKQELDDWLNDRYAEYITTDELDAEWDGIVEHALSEIVDATMNDPVNIDSHPTVARNLASWDTALAKPLLHRCEVCGVAIPFDEWPKNDPCPVCYPLAE